jgi:hypothetical protein
LPAAGRRAALLAAAVLLRACLTLVGRRSTDPVATAAARPQGSTWADPLPLPRRSRKRPPDAARKALRSTNSPAATMSAYRPFAARREPLDKPALGESKGEGFGLAARPLIPTP